MDNFNKVIIGYQKFREKYAHGDESIMKHLALNGQQPKIMVVACCDSRVDPGLILQCDPGDLFVTRNVANIVPPYEKDKAHHGTSAALEFAVCYLNVEHIIILGHSQCGGIQALLNSENLKQNDFITNWLSTIQTHDNKSQYIKNPDGYTKLLLNQSYQNCLTFPWIKEKVEKKQLIIHLWFFDIESGRIFSRSNDNEVYQPL